MAKKKMLTKRKATEAAKDKDEEPEPPKSKRTTRGAKKPPPPSPPPSPRVSKRGKEKKEKEAKQKKDKEEQEKKAAAAPAVPKKKAAAKKKAEEKKKAKQPESEEDKDDDKKEQEEEEEKKMVYVQSKGGVVVDPYMPGATKYRVVVEGTAVFNKDLMFSDVVHNNNKFYKIQLLESDTATPGLNVTLFTRWGRVGEKGSIGQAVCDRARGKSEFTKKFFQKTGKGYKEVKISYENANEQEEEDDDPEAGKDTKKADSKLPKKVKDLMEMIFDVQTLDTTLKQIGYDAKKMPLGKLSEATLNEGYEWLKKISNVIDKSSSGNLNELCSEFYTCIPHDFGRQHMSKFIIKTQEELKQKIEILDTLKDMTVASKIIKKGKGASECPADVHYKELECDLTPLDPASDRYKLLAKYYANTSKGFWNQTQLKEIFEINRHGEAEKFKKNKGSLHNHMLLWHGSRVSNFGGILRQGLRIAPPEAPSAGYNFGKGLYFADMATKSLNYCRAGGNSELLIMLVEVAIGEPNVKMNFDFNAAKLPTGKHSTWGVGTEAPSVTEEIEGGLKVPVGEGAPNPKGKWLGFNEFIVYDVTQVQLRYLLRCKVN